MLYCIMIILPKLLTSGEKMKKKKGLMNEHIYFHQTSLY
ncbi:hypothetical protein KR50_31000 [Jeotgalibacillus campisalis]|uniref:Uncharacterized protein n=1 Tax=Jeotgalibacillus campisalis TaxID=220754 RepID=A0A0C2R882_9BACL|nr:hypothetical protein KR50_31000 [Jeotgalibacillus campisalis]